MCGDGGGGGGLGLALLRLCGASGSNLAHRLCLRHLLCAACHRSTPLQARYSKSVEGVVAALVDDTVALSKAAQAHSALAVNTQGQLQDTKEALLRSATVFATVLKIPPPISSSLWSTTASASPSRIAAGSLAGGSCGGRYVAAAAAASAALQHSSAGSPARNRAADASGASGSPLRSKYDSLLGALA